MYRFASGINKNINLSKYYTNLLNGFKKNNVKSDLHNYFRKCDNERYKLNLKYFKIV